MVAVDEREGDLRRVLNFGHTIGHAAEAASDFTIPHGNAVAMGMVAVSRLAALIGRLDPAEVDRLRTLLVDFGLPVTIPPDLDRAEIRKYLLTDKKTVAGKVFFVLPEEIGRVIITAEVSPSAVDQVIQQDL